MIIAALADSDSYLKWAAATIDRLAPDADRRVVVVENPVMPSEQQRRHALAGTSFDVADVAVLGVEKALASLRDADAVLVAARGETAAYLLRRLAARESRPVLLSGIPGIAFPITRKALIYRAQADAIIVHSHRERRSALELAERYGWPVRPVLANLPFLERRPSAGDDVVLAAQALVPRTRHEREHLVSSFVAAARAHPQRRFVLKVRAVSGERQTHVERWALDSLAPMMDAPANLVVRAGSMTSALDTAGAVVSVSSTALIEAVARGIPVLAIDDYGVDEAHINTVFRGSGVLGDTSELVAGRFRVAATPWTRDNYLHESRDVDAPAVIRELVALREQSGLPARRPVRSTRGGRLREAWDRRRAFGEHDPSALGVLAVVVGTPARVALIAGRRVLRGARSLTGSLR